MIRKGARVALIALFCAFIAAFAILYIALPKATFSEREKRELAAFPEISAAAIFDGSFESGFESWMTDHIPARDALVGVNAYYELASGRNGLGGTLLADGRLYDAADPLDGEAMLRKCALIDRFAQDSGLPVDVLLIPTSGYMHEGELPMHAKYHDGELAELVRESLGENVNFLWPEEALRAKLDEGLYYDTDHHLTSRGEYELCRFYAESLGMSMPEEANYDVEAVEDFYGSMYSQSGLWGVKPDALEIWRSRSLPAVQVNFDDREGSDSLFFPAHLSEMDKYPVFLDGNHGLVTIETGREEGENLLMIRDSFGHCFAPFAADCFKRIVLVDLRYYRRSVRELAKEMDIDRALVLYGVDTFLTDTNMGWLR